MTERRVLSLRSILTAVTIVVIPLVLVVAGALVVLTTLIHRTTSGMAMTVESIHLVREAEVDLLLHSRTDDGLLRRDIEERVARRLSEARRFVTGEDEARVFADAEARVDAYIEGSRNPRTTPDDLAALQERAYGALGVLAESNLADARDAYAIAAAWNERADYIGIGVGVLVLLVSLGVHLWLKHRAFAPVLSLAAAMDRFGTGDHDARAEETGPAELREISRLFNEMAATLSAQRRARIAFLGGVAHDLRNPLSVLKTSMALLPPEKPLPPERHLRQMLERIDRQITRLERMAGDFLEIAKLEAGELELRPGLHDARDLVEEVVELFQGTFPEPRLVVSLPEEAVPLYCDNLRIEQVLTNLMSNAIKYSPVGSPIEVGVERENDGVVFSVRDHGVGIPEEDHQRVFEPFRRVGPSRGEAPGVGLGLHVVRRLVEAHGGRVELQSAPGAGTTVRFRVPSAEGPGRARGSSHSRLGVGPG